VLSDLHISLKLPDPWQHQAVSALRAGSDVIVSAPTGAGKTYIFELLHEAAHFKSQCVYTVPTRALANDKFAEWREKGWDVGIATGDVSENIHAPVLVATLETQLERLIRGEGPALLVIDEYQMIADAGRGAHYEAAIALAPMETRLLMLSGSVANPGDVAEWMRRLGRPVGVVQTRERPVPLEEMPVEMLPQRMSRHFQNFWPKLAAAVLLGDLAPLLIFSPRRREAEKIARALADELPQGEPLSLTQDQKNVCGRELSNLLEKRIAYHHSGLSYAARAGVIEPLAKSGQLRVIVATMGLAAGINFSVRSVHIAATRFHDGTSEHAISSDELLQMFGRAGRRGLDEKGHVITTRQSPALSDGRPARLARSSLLAWPVFLRVMRHAAARGANPFEAAAQFAARLFAKAPPPLGLETEEPAKSPLHEIHHRDGKATFGLEAMETQVMNSRGEWETKHPLRTRIAKLGEAWIANPQYQGLALTQAKFVSALSQGLGRVFKLERAMPTADQGAQQEPTPTFYGLEVALGQPLAESPHCFRPTKALRRVLNLNRNIEDVSLHEFEQRHRLKLARRLAPDFTHHAKESAEPDAASLPQYRSHAARDGLLLARYDLRGIPVEVYEDHAGRLLLLPMERTVPREQATGIDLEKHRYDPKPGSAIHAWRSLGLIDASGVPTRRGEIVSFFQAGEGLAVAAALEDVSYPVDELVKHMANLRAGFRFELAGHSDSERLGASCRRVYGFVNHHGYLENGLPVDYGEGAAEVIDALLHKDRRQTREGPRGFAEGDVSRAYIEWLSLIRHVTHAPDHSWERWIALKEECRAVLKKHTAATRHLFHLDLPPLTNKQRQSRPKHYLMSRE
jgi:hypothetical protein